MPLEVRRDLAEPVLRGHVERVERLLAERAIDIDAMPRLELRDRAGQSLVEHRTARRRRSPRRRCAAVCPSRRRGLRPTCHRDSFRFESRAQCRDALRRVRLPTLQRLPRRDGLPSALLDHLAKAHELLLQRRVLLVVRPHRVDGLVERLLDERAHERAVDVVVARIDVPALSHGLRIDLPDEKVFAKRRIRGGEQHVDVGQLLGGRLLRRAHHRDGLGDLAQRIVVDAKSVRRRVEERVGQGLDTVLVEPASLEPKR